MLRHVGSIALLLGSLTASASAQQLPAAQPVRASVYGVLQFGPQVRPTVVAQSGQANIAGVMQVGPGAAVAIRQSGRANAAYVGQYENLFRGASAGMP